MKSLKFILLSLLLFGCSISPEQASDELERSAAHPEEWCGYEHELESATIEKFNVVPGYGRREDGYGCQDGAWPGGVCYIPSSRTETIKVVTTSDSAWNNLATLEQNVIVARMNNLGWSLTATTGSLANLYMRTGTTHSSGFLGRAVPSQYTAYSDENGIWIEHARCDAYLYRTSIEANVFYQAASEGERVKYIRNLWDHEAGGHCLGLPHCAPGSSCTNTLMGEAYTYPGVWFTSNLSPTSTERSWLQNYFPH